MLHNDLICSYELHLSKALHLVPRGLKYRAHVCSAALSLNHWLSISISISSPTSISTGTCPFLPCNPSYWLISREASPPLPPVHHQMLLSSRSSRSSSSRRGRGWRRRARGLFFLQHTLIVH